MAREEYSTIVTRSLDHFYLLLPVARSDESSRRLPFLMAGPGPAMKILE
jgi:hypothetical protein